VMRIVAREIEMGERLMREEVDALADLLGHPKPHLHASEDVRRETMKLNEELSAKIRAGEADQGLFRERVLELTRRVVEDKLKIANPRYLEADLKLRQGIHS
jgi:alcohol dehydrogenase class IV